MQFVAGFVVGVLVYFGIGALVVVKKYRQAKKLKNSVQELDDIQDKQEK